MVPVLIDLGPLTLHSFGAMMALAFLVAGYVVAVGLDRKGMDPEHAWSIVLWGAVGGIVGARLFVIFSDWRGFLDHPLAGSRLVRRPEPSRPKRSASVPATMGRRPVRRPLPSGS